MWYDRVKMVKKSIFQLWSGIVLGWSDWPKNAPKVHKKYFFGPTMPCGGTLGCHLDTRPSTEIVIWPELLRLWTMCELGRALWVWHGFYTIFNYRI